jgi:hypothetical protein
MQKHRYRDERTATVSTHNGRRDHCRRSGVPALPPNAELADPVLDNYFEVSALPTFLVQNIQVAFGYSRTFDSTICPLGAGTVRAGQEPGVPATNTGFIPYVL